MEVEVGHAGWRRTCQHAAAEEIQPNDTTGGRFEIPRELVTEASSGHFIFVRLFIVVKDPCTSCTLDLFDLRINHVIASLN